MGLPGRAGARSGASKPNTMARAPTHLAASEWTRGRLSAPPPLLAFPASESRVSNPANPDAASPCHKAKPEPTCGSCPAQHSLTFCKCVAHPYRPPQSPPCVASPLLLCFSSPFTVNSTSSCLLSISVYFSSPSRERYWAPAACRLPLRYRSLDSS